MTSDTKTTIGSIVGAVGTGLTAGGFFFPPLFLVGGVLSAVAKVWTGLNTKGVTEASPGHDPQTGRFVTKS